MRFIKIRDKGWSFITAFAIIQCGFACQGRDVFVLSKEEAMIRALERNMGIRIERSRVHIAEQDIELEKGIFDPAFKASLSMERMNGVEGSSMSVGGEGILPTGGSYYVGLDVDKNLTEINKYTSFAGLRFRQPILKNFGLSSNLAALRIARYQFDLSEWAYKQLLLDTLASVLFAYNDLYEAQQNLESAIRIRDLTKETLVENNKRVELGVMAELDMIETRAQLASREERVLAATNAVIQGQSRLKQLIFDNAKEALGVDLKVAVYTEPEVNDEFNVYLSTLLENSPRFQIGAIGLEIARLRLSRDKNQTLPSLDLIAEYGFRGNADSFGDSIDSAISTRDDSYTLGVSLQLPFLNQSNRAQAIISKERETIARVDLERIKQAIELEFYTSFEIVQTNYQRVAATRLAQDLAKQSLEAEEKKLNAGTSSTFFILRLQSDLALAESRAISARANYNRSVADFNRLRGVLE